MKDREIVTRNRGAHARRFCSAMAMVASVVLCVADAAAETPSNAKEAIHADDVAKRRNCLGLSTSDESYRQAAIRLVNTNFVKNWMAGLGAKRLAFGNNVDKTEYISGRCYWQISIYESDEERLQLWNIFRLRSNGGEVYLVRPNGKAVSLSHEKKQMKGN